MISKKWLEDTITLPRGKGKLEIQIHDRNVIFVSGEVLGYKIYDYEVDKRFGAAHWGPGWMTRMDMGMFDEEKPNAQVTKIIIAAIEEWAKDNAYRLDLAGQDDFRRDAEDFIGFVEEFEEKLEEAVEDNINILLNKYGDWIAKLNNAEMTGHLEKLIAMIAQVRQHLENVIEPDMRSLGKAILARFPREADLKIGPNWRPPHRQNELKAKPVAKAARPKRTRAKKAKAPAVAEVQSAPAAHVNGFHTNGNGLAAEMAL